MADLISTFKSDHQNIRKELENIKSIGTDYASMQAALKEIKEVFLVHMSLEDSEFYVQLRRRVNLTADLLRTLDSIVKDLESLKISSLIFFEKYAKPEEDIMEREFAFDFHNFYERVLNRIDLEENQLFPLFGRYIKKL